MKLKQKEIDVRRQELFLESDVEEAATRSKRELPREDEVRDSLRDLNQLKENAREALRDVDKVADTSRNLKGPFVRTLRVAATRAKVAELEARIRLALK